jgi:glucose uptake protein GlcU
MYTADYVIIAAICGLASAFVARRKGRNQYLWFFIGSIFSVFAVVLISFLKKKISNRTKE